ncbi:MAG TPA: oligopeptide/dipeptide ABC transporter ATP-binding protein, partial [Thermomicrobiales bacterium]|nr:oligopeptide/dipeptide ABC transporter ATP-binding protein [Thermomicrobiales bacterium]
RGQVVETGEVEQVLRHPQHPYTQLLLDSIPSPDPDQRWTADTTEIARLEAEAGVLERDILVS